MLRGKMFPISIKWEILFVSLQLACTVYYSFWTGKQLDVCWQKVSRRIELQGQKREWSQRKKSHVSAHPSDVMQLYSGTIDS